MEHTNTPAEQKQATVASKGHWNVLCVDDEKSVLSALKRVLKAGNYNVFLASDAQEALFLLEYQPIDIIISDMMMPGMNGADFLAESLTISPNSIRILLTGHSNIESTIAAINEGQVHRFLQKPWDNDELLMVLNEATKKLSLERENTAMLATIARQNKQLATLNKQLEERVDVRTKQVKTALNRAEKANSRAQSNHRNTLRVFFNLISQNPNLQGHLAMEISELCHAFSTALGLEHKEARAVRLAGLLNELGLLCLPEEIATTPFIRMNKEQREKFLSHPVVAANALAPSIALNNVAEAIKHQFEHMDGSGTPDRLWGDQIPIGSRILSIARDYVLSKATKANLPNAEAETLEELSKQSGRWYDTSLLNMLPEILQLSTENQKVHDEEELLTSAQLIAGMELSRPLISEQKLLLLSENHILTEESIERVRSFEKANQENFKIYTFVMDKNTNEEDSTEA